MLSWILNIMYVRETLRGHLLIMLRYSSFAYFQNEHFMFPRIPARSDFSAMTRGINNSLNKTQGRSMPRFTNARTWVAARMKRVLAHVHVRAVYVRVQRFFGIYFHSLIGAWCNIIKSISSNLHISVIR